MRRLLLWLFLLLQALVFVSAEVQHPLDSAQREDAQGDAFRSEVAATAGGPPGREPGADLVDTALSELRKIHQPLQRIRKHDGILSSALRYALKALPSFQMSAPPPDSSRHVVNGPLQQAVKLLEESSQKNNSDALYLLAEMNFYGNFSYPRNFPTAFDYYQKLALQNGNGSALYMLGLMYSTGIGGAVQRDQARALLYYTFAANSGHTRAEMTLAHRHQSGLATPASCETAAKYYKRVADKAIAWYRSGPPGGMAWISEAYRIADENGGVYGEGASVSSSGVNALRAHPHSDAYASIEDIIEYLDLMAQKGDFKASFNLGRIYYDGQRGLERDFSQARKYFTDVASKFWKRGRIVDNYKSGLEKTAARAAGFIGLMYLRGEGVEQSFDKAKSWFERGISQRDAQSQYGMGMLLMNGYGTAKDIARATELFKSAVDQDFAPAQVEMGSLYLDQGHADDLNAAHGYFELAARQGNLEAFYYLAEMSYYGVGRDKSCTTAVSFYKRVSEGAEPLVSSWAEANIAYEDGDVELAFLEYLGAAEQGYEKAQNNVAYILDPVKSCLPIPPWLLGQSGSSTLLDNPSLALVYWTRSSRQGNTDSLVKMGDYYLYGIGTPSDVDKAVQCYTGASEYHQSAQALYNLGWMHEYGVGLTQDYHLAKRYYDSALETNDEAYLPVTLSLLKLRVKSAWNTFTNGRINSIQDEPVVGKDWSLSEWIANFVTQEDFGYYDDQQYDDIYDDTMPGGDAVLGEMDDSILESLLIVGLAAALVFLIMYRNQAQAAARRREEETQRQQQQQQQQQGGRDAQGVPAVNQPLANQGLFGQFGAPDLGQWVPGGVGSLTMNR